MRSSVILSPFTPEGDDFTNTDQIYVGNVQTGSLDGYSNFAGRLNGPLTAVLDYSSLVSNTAAVTTLTLGIGADDFQFQAFGQPFVASINGLPNATLTSILNSFEHTGPQVQYFTLGLDPSVYVNAGKTLTVSIDELGNGGDGFAVDFFTVGVTTVTVPEPGTFALLGLVGAPFAFALARRRK